MYNKLNMNFKNTLMHVLKTLSKSLTYDFQIVDIQNSLWVRIQNISKNDIQIKTVKILWFQH